MFVSGVVLILLGGVLFDWHFLFPEKEIVIVPTGEEAGVIGRAVGIKTKEELVAEALEKSSNIKALYMTADVANDQGAAGTRLRNNLIRLAETTEINALVLDVKEACGIDYNEAALKKLLDELHQKNIWAIARIVVMSDASQMEMHPEWYITRAHYKKVGSACANKKRLLIKSPDGNKPQVIFWQDRAGKYWIDPAHPGGRAHIADFSRRMIDFGFDELQYDYIRFISDGDVGSAVFPSWNGKTQRCLVIRDYFRALNQSLKSYKPEIILSADLFGYAAIGIDTGIGQCLDALEDNFDYVSFMTYSSHYYNGFRVPPLRGLPAINYASTAEARAHPDVIVERSLIFARDFFDGKIDLLGRISTSTATSTIGATSTVVVSEPPQPRSHARLRPWIEDFFHEQDKAAGRPAYAQKVRLQVEAAEKVESHGWMLWNAGNVYTEGALKKE